MIDNEKKGDSRDVWKERLNLAVCHGQRAPCISGTFILQSWKTIYSYINVCSLKAAPKNTINLSVVQVFLHKNTNVRCLFAISGLQNVLYF